MPGTTGFLQFTDHDAYVLSSGIRNARLRTGLSQEKFAKELGVKQQTVMGWELGRHAPPVLRLLQIHQQFGASWEDLLGV